MIRYFYFLIIINLVQTQKIIIPMDNVQNDHLKAYGIAYFSISKGHNVEWLLNYRGGSFLVDKVEILTYECKIRGVSFEDVSGSKLIDIYSTIEQNNMDIILLEKNIKGLEIEIGNNEYEKNSELNLLARLSLGWTVNFKKILKESKKDKVLLFREN